MKQNEHLPTPGKSMEKNQRTFTDTREKYGKESVHKNYTHTSYFILTIQRNSSGINEKTHMNRIYPTQPYLHIIEYKKEKT